MAKSTRITNAPFEVDGGLGQAQIPTDNTGAAVGEVGRAATKAAFSVFDTILANDRLVATTELKYSREDLLAAKAEQQYDRSEIALNNFASTYFTEVQALVAEGNNGAALLRQKTAKLDMWRIASEQDVSLVDNAAKKDQRERYASFIADDSPFLSQTIKTGDYPVGVALISLDGNGGGFIGDQRTRMLDSVMGNFPVEAERTLGLLQSPDLATQAKGEQEFQELVARQHDLNRANANKIMMDSDLASLGVTGKELANQKTQLEINKLMNQQDGVIGQSVSVQALRVRNRATFGIENMISTGTLNDKNVQEVVESVNQSRTDAKDDLSVWASYPGYTQAIAEIDRVAEEQVEYINTFNELARVTKDTDILSMYNEYRQEVAKTGIAGDVLYGASTQRNPKTVAMNYTYGKMLTDTSFDNPQFARVVTKNMSMNNPANTTLRQEMSTYNMFHDTSSDLMTRDNKAAQMFAVESVIDPIQTVTDNVTEFITQYNSPGAVSDDMLRWDMQFAIDSISTVLLNDKMVDEFSRADRVEELDIELRTLKAALNKIEGATIAKYEGRKWGSSKADITPSSMFRKMQDALGVDLSPLLQKRLDELEAIKEEEAAKTAE